MIDTKYIEPASGKLTVFLPGLGAVATTMIAGVMLARQGKGTPVGSLTQLGKFRDEAGKSTPIKDAAPLAQLDQLEFAAWDIFPENAYESAKHAGVLNNEHLELVREQLTAIEPMPGAFFPEYVKRLHGTHIKRGASKADLVEQLRADIRRTLEEKKSTRGVAVWTGSTEVYTTPGTVHATIADFEAGLRRSDPSITSSQLYAWAFIKERIPFANGSPNLAVDFPAALDLAREYRVSVGGKDFKTGQTMMKTVLAPALKTRLLGLRGWYSTNILGNRDGEVLDDADSFRSKEVSKLGVLESILQPEENHELYGNLVHKVRIDYYPPRGDDKEGWDNIDLFGWLGYPMQIKVNFLCKDSILAAPIVLDLALLMDLSQRAGFHGIQDWLSFYFKSPQHEAGTEPMHNLFEQEAVVMAKLRMLAGLAAAGPISSEGAADSDVRLPKTKVA
ncbi:MAG: inositol-3-phosphate synthase [Labilithrix sp.]|nr:inositol-3-phosphate synthase [Labilithrix sp.]